MSVPSIKPSQSWVRQQRKEGQGKRVSRIKRTTEALTTLVRSLHSLNRSSCSLHVSAMIVSAVKS